MTDHPKQVPAEFVPPSVWTNPWHFLAFGFGSGTLPKAPGTWGSMVAVPFIPLWQMLPDWGYWLMLGITMVAAPGVPGGAIMAAVGILQSMLGFDETAISIMIATYVAIDSIGTATNVTGDGAIAVAIDRFSKKSEDIDDDAVAEDPQPSAV